VNQESWRTAALSHKTWRVKWE